MKKAILIFTLIIACLSTFAQIPHGRYFEEISETTWLSPEISSSSDLAEFSKFGLRIIENDQILPNTTVWSFNETLKIESYHSSTKESKTILECNYEHNKENRLLRLFIDNEVLEFEYLPTSSGAYIGFTQIKGENL